MKYWIETYGCQMNKAESDALELELLGCGWVKAEVPETAAFVILNTCSVRKTAEERIIGRIGFYKRIKKDNPSQLLIITGCMAERLGNKLIGKDSPVNKVFGTFEKNKIIDYISGKNSTEDSDKSYRFKKTHSIIDNNKYNAFIPIMNGCNNFCSYCIVPYVRGREISRTPIEIINEIKTLDSASIKEITLLGQNVNSYKYQFENKEIDFSDLLAMISDETDNIEWIRFLTSHPKDLSEKLIKIMAESKKLCKHIHLPLQSGSTSVLKMMNRSYTAEHYLSLVDTLRSYMPDISITTDIITGFPGETEKDFENTCEIMKKVKFNEAFTYYYNKLEGTKSYDFEDNITKEEKLKRLSIIIDLQKTISTELKTAKIGKKYKVFAVDYSKKNKNKLFGRNESDEMVVFSAEYDKIGSMLEVEIIALKGNTFNGIVIKE